MKGQVELRPRGASKKFPFTREGRVPLTRLSRLISPSPGYSPTSQGGPLIRTNDPGPRPCRARAAGGRAPQGIHRRTAFTEHLEELARLVDTAGAEVVGRITQHIASPNPATLIGEGKVEELASEVAAHRSRRWSSSTTSCRRRRAPTWSASSRCGSWTAPSSSSTSSPPGRGATRPSCRWSWRSWSTCCRG